MKWIVLMDRMNQTCKFPHDEFAYRKASQFSSFLKTLVEANEYAADLITSPWDFAIQFDQASASSITKNDINWMVRRGWIHCQSSPPAAADAVFPTGFHPDAKFIISEAGTSAFNRVENSPGLCESSESATHRNQFSKTNDVPMTPEWNVARRELSFSGKVVKRFRWPAPNQETIISVFAEDGWPPRIEDPLTQGQGLDPKRRLGDTIKCLNRNQETSLLRFRGDGTGEGVLWDVN